MQRWTVLNCIALGTVSFASVSIVMSTNQRIHVIYVIYKRTIDTIIIIYRHIVYSQTDEMILITHTHTHTHTHNRKSIFATYSSVMSVFLFALMIVLLIYCVLSIFVILINIILVMSNVDCYY